MAGMKDPNSAPTTILIVEDSPLQAKIIRNYIQLYSPFKVVMAHSMSQTEEMLRQMADQLFVAVIDLNLPDAPNGEAADLCLSWQLPSIVLTASFNDAIRKNFIERQVIDYFFKGSIRDLAPLVTSIQRIYKNQFITVLVVDDSRTQRAHLRRLLLVQRLSVLEAEDGMEALAVIGANPHIDLVITDYQMPRMDGLELIRELRMHRRMDQLGIIGVSAVGCGPLTASFLKNGANDFLTKPFEVEEFYWRVNQTLELQDMIKQLNQQKHIA